VAEASVGTVGAARGRGRSSAAGGRGENGGVWGDLGSHGGVERLSIQRARKTTNKINYSSFLWFMQFIFVTRV